MLTLDGDDKHDPDDIPQLLAASAALPGTRVIGSRLANGGASMEPARLNAQRVAGFFINWLVGRAVADTQSGFRVYPRKLLETGEAAARQFVLESEDALARAAAGAMRVPVDAGARGTAESLPARSGRHRRGDVSHLPRHQRAGCGNAGIVAACS